MPIVSLSTRHFNAVGVGSANPNTASATGAAVAPALSLASITVAHATTASAAVFNPLTGAEVVGPLRAYEASAMPTDAASDNTPLALGLEFYVTAAANCLELRFWQPDNNSPSTAIRTGALWRVDSSTTGTNISGTISFAATISGWNTLTLSPPVALTANQRYRAVVFYPAGRYTATASDYYNTGPGSADLVNGVLVVPSAANTTGNNQNSFIESADMAFPTSSFNANQYGIDVAIATPAGRRYITATTAGVSGKAIAPFTADGDITHGTQLTTSNTGVPSGTTLTTQATSGGSVPAGTYVDKLFPDPTPDGSYIISSGPATFTNCRFQGGVLLDSANDVTFTRCEIQGGLGVSSSHRTNFTRCRIYDGSDLVHITGDQPGVSTTCDDITFIETLIDAPGNLGPGDHCDGIQTRGIKRFTFLRSAVVMGPQFDNAGDLTPLNASIFFENANGGSDTITVQDSYLDGGGQVYFIQACIGTKVVTGNRWGPDFTFSRVRNDSGVTYTDWSDNRVLADNALLSP